MQEGESAKLIATCESLHAQFEELDESKLTIANKIRLAEFQKQLVVEMLAIYTEAKSRLSNPSNRSLELLRVVMNCLMKCLIRIPESSETRLAEHTERLEQLKCELRSLRSAQFELEPYFDIILRHAQQAL